MRTRSILGCVLFCMTSLQSIAQVDSMEINGEYYKIYPYPENVKVNSDYWIAVKDKEYFLDPENYFHLYGEGRAFTRGMYDTATSEELTVLNNKLKRKWKNLRSKDGRLGLGPRYVKQVRKHPEALIAPKYIFNQEVMPPFGAIPDGKYVQLFSEFCLVDKKGECQPQTNRVAGYFDIKNNSLDGHAVWLDLKGDTIKQGVFKDGLKEGVWTLNKIDRPSRKLNRYTTWAFRKYGKFHGLDTTFTTANYHRGVLEGDYSYYDSETDIRITGHFINGEESGTWTTLKGNHVIRKVTYADATDEIRSKKPIIRTSSFFDGNRRKYNLERYKFGRMEIPTDFYEIGFEEELDIELEEEGFQSHELEYYGRYYEDDLPMRFREEGNRFGAIDYRHYSYYQFEQDPRTKLVETRGHFIDSIGAKMLYDGPYEIFYPNGQLYVRYQFENGELVDEGTLYWDNGEPHDVIEFVADSNHYLRRAYDYDGKLYRTAIYDSLGDFVKFDEPTYEAPFLAIDGIEAELIDIGYNKKKFYNYLRGNFVYKNWPSVEEEEFTDKEVVLYKRWSGIDTSVLGVTKYNPVTRTLTDYDWSYTGNKYWDSEKVFTEDFGSWTGKSTWTYGDFEVVKTASGILHDFTNDTLPQRHLRNLYYHYDVTEDVEIFLNGELYTGKVKLKSKATRFKAPKKKLVLYTSYYGGRNKIQKKLYKYFKKGKDAELLDLVSSISDCAYAGSYMKDHFFPVVNDGYFYSHVDEEETRLSDYIYKIKGQAVEGKAQGPWTGKGSSGKLMSKLSFDRGQPIGIHNRYAVHYRVSRYFRKRSLDTLPKRNIYFLLSSKEYVNGMRNGPYNRYFWHGAIKEKGTFLDDYLEGEYFTRYNLAYSKSNFKNGLLDGYVQTYLTLPYEDTMLLYDLNFQDGMLNGKSVAYHTNGKLAKQGFFLDGEPIDDYEAFDTYGFRYHYVKFKYSHPVEEKIWEENELSLRYMFNWEDSIQFDPSDITNSMSLESLMYKLGYGHGDFEDEYYGRPRLIDKTGLTYHMTKFYPNDTVARQGNINDGKKIGHWTFFDYEGEFLYEVNYFDSIISLNDSVMFKSKGFLTDYDAAGNKLYDAYIIEKMEKYDCAHTDHYEIRQLYTVWEANDTTGRMNGYVQNFYDNGVLQNEGRMKDGLPDGLWKYYDPFGKLNLMGAFHQGKRNGRWLSGDLEQKKYLGEICLNPNLPDLEDEKSYRENLLDVTIINYKLGKAMNKQFYDLNLNKYSNLKND